MDKQALIERLLALPVDIEAAEKHVLSMSQAVDAAREQVAVIEKDAIAGSGPVVKQGGGVSGS